MTNVATLLFRRPRLIVGRIWNTRLYLRISHAHNRTARLLLNCIGEKSCRNAECSDFHIELFHIFNSQLSWYIYIYIYIYRQDTGLQITESWVRPHPVSGTLVNTQQACPDGCDWLKLAQSISTKVSLNNLIALSFSNVWNIIARYDMLLLALHVCGMGMSKLVITSFNIVPIIWLKWHHC